MSVSGRALKVWTASRYTAARKYVAENRPFSHISMGVCLTTALWVFFFMSEADFKTDNTLAILFAKSFITMVGSFILSVFACAAWVLFDSNRGAVRAWQVTQIQRARSRDARQKYNEAQAKRAKEKLEHRRFGEINRAANHKAMIEKMEQDFFANAEKIAALRGSNVFEATLAAHEALALLRGEQP